MNRRNTKNTIMFSNNDMFVSVLQSKPEVAKRIAEFAIGTKISNPINLFVEETVINGATTKGVRFDAHLIGENEEVVIELQTYNEKNLPHRMRLYQGSIDARTIEKGDEYTGLKKLYIIFICTYNVNRKKISKYETVDLSDGEPLNDGVTKIIVNTKSKNGVVSNELQEFIDYLETNIPTNEFSKQLDYYVTELNNDEEWRKGHMLRDVQTMMERAHFKEEGLIEGKAEGLIEGKEEGLIEGKAETQRAAILGFYEQGVSKETIAAGLNITLEEVERVLSIDQKHCR